MKGKILLENYIDGWKHYNLEEILSPLAEDCLVIESHGPTYRGKKVVEEWIEDWHEKGNRVKSWDILSFYDCKATFFLEWKFSYTGKNIREEFDGITVAKVKNHLISYLKEYRMTAPSFSWIK